MTFEHDAVIVTLAERASAQIRAGLASIHAGEPLQGEVFLNAASATLASLQAHLDGTPPPKPMRKLALVIGPTREAEDRFPEVREYEEEPLPPWMNTKKDGPNGAA